MGWYGSLTWDGISVGPYRGMGFRRYIPKTGKEDNIRKKMMDKIIITVLHLVFVYLLDMIIAIFCQHFKIGFEPDPFVNKFIDFPKEMFFNNFVEKMATINDVFKKNWVPFNFHTKILQININKTVED